MAEVHCIYHAGCPDGFAALWVITEAHTDSTVVAWPGRFGDPPPAEIPDGSKVVIADFSYPREQLEAFAARMEWVTVLDHHQTAQADLEGLRLYNMVVVFDMDRSGAGIAWDYYFSGPLSAPPPEGVPLHGVGRPVLLHYVEARDLWRMDEPNVPEVGAFVMTLEHDLGVWSEAMLLDEADLVVRGSGALAQRRQHCRAIVEHSAMATFDPGVGGLWVMPVVNVSYPIASEAADHLMTVWGTDSAGYFFQRADGSYQYGFRSRGDVDVSVLAKQLGGGGHKHAAGCQGFEEPIHLLVDQ